MEIDNIKKLSKDLSFYMTKPMLMNITNNKTMVDKVFREINNDLRSIGKTTSPKVVPASKVVEYLETTKETCALIWWEFTGQYIGKGKEDTKKET